MEKLIEYLENLLFVLIPEFIFGVKAQGERLSEPTFKTVYPAKPIAEKHWVRKYKFGSRYGHRGSFYQH